MQRINLTKYGFIRDREEDFSDDGNRFQGYRVGKRVRVSKLVADGDAYISATINNGTLTYEEYSKLPHYKDLDALNGVSTATLTDADLIKLYEDCIAYEKEFEEAETNSVFPSRQEIREKYERVKAIREDEIKKITSAVTVDILLSWPKNKLTSFSEYFTSLKRQADINPEALAMALYGTARSKSYVWSQQDESASFYFTCLTEFIEGKRNW